MTRRARIRTALAVSVAVLVLCGCTPTVTLTPAPDATAVECAGVVARVRSIDALGGEPYRQTDAQGTAAWGDPVSVVLRCGVEDVPSDRCVTVDGVDWKVQNLEEAEVRLSTYGRDPALEVVVDTTAVSQSDVLPPISSVIAAAVPADRRCPTTVPAPEDSSAAPEDPSPATDGPSPASTPSTTPDTAP